MKSQWQVIKYFFALFRIVSTHSIKQGFLVADYIVVDEMVLYAGAFYIWDFYATGKFWSEVLATIKEALVCSLLGLMVPLDIFCHLSLVILCDESGAVVITRYILLYPTFWITRRLLKFKKW